MTCREWHPFYLSGFIRAEGAFHKAEGKLLVFKTADGIAVYPVLAFSFVNEGGITYDLRGQLYAGPISSADSPERHAELIRGLRSAMKEAASAYGWVTDFCRLNPFTSTPPSEEDVSHISNHVYVDLTLGYERIWKGYEPAARRNVKGANRSAAEMRPLLNETEYLSFGELYQRRMNELRASPRYRYGREYFRALYRDLSDYSLVVGAFVEGQLVAGSFNLKGNGRLLSHLLAVDPTYRHFKLGTGLLDLAIRLAIQQGCKIYLLGGGVRGEDKVFAYKKSLTQDMLSQVRLDIILDKERYQRLSARYCTQKQATDFFPPYRQTQEATHAS
jgi:GNAT superfamily N-acetyltransferase